MKNIFFILCFIGFLATMIIAQALFVELWCIGELIVACLLLIQIILTFRFYKRKSALRAYSLIVLALGLILLAFESFNLLGYSEVMKATEDHGFYNVTISLKDNGRFEFGSASMFGSSEPQKGSYAFELDSIYFNHPLKIKTDKYFSGKIQGSKLILIGSPKDTLTLGIVINKIQNEP
jgi:hypothetical protein